MYLLITSFIFFAGEIMVTLYFVAKWMLVSRVDFLFDRIVWKQISLFKVRCRTFDFFARVWDFPIFSKYDNFSDTPVTKKVIETKNCCDQI